MKCQECEQASYLYEELTADEKEKVDEHVSTCAACALLFNEWKQAEELISHAKEIPLLPENAARLTHQIMQAIESEQKASRFDFRWLWRGEQWVRYGFALMSVIFVVLFITEQQQYPSAANSSLYSASSQMDVILNSNAFIKARQEVRKSPGKMSFTSLQACAKQNDCSHTLIQNFKTKRAL